MAVRTHAGLTHDEAGFALGCAVERRIVSAQAFYAFGAALCVFSTYCSLGVILLVQLNYVIAPRLPVLKRL